MKRFGGVAVLSLSLLLAACAEDCRQGPCSPDERLVEAVRANIAKHPALMTDTIRIQADNGTIYLYGLVSTDLERYELEDVAKATPGVSKVVNNCAVDNIQR
jgi:osmotically-inducible protein OsmY